MGNFHVKDAQMLLQQSGDLMQIGQNVRRVSEDISDCCRQISNAWQSDTEDKTSYLGNLEKNINKIYTLVDAINSLSSKLTDFANESIRTANNG